MTRTTETNLYRISGLDSDTVKNYEIFIKIFLYRTRETILPELFHIFGKETLIEFLSLFSGCIVKVPTEKIINHMVEDSYIYTLLEDSKDIDYSIKQLGKKFNKSPEEIKISYAKVSSMLEEIKTE